MRNTSLIGFSDQLHLYNAMGIMISASWIPAQFKGNDQLRVARSVLEPMMRSLSENVRTISSTNTISSDCD